MKRCVFILPWFGPLRNYFSLFLRSCEANPNYDWLLITDQTIPEVPGNVEIVSMTFPEFQAYVQSKFDFPLALNRPYKICDFKPALGYVLEDKLKEYEYWAHCDCDLVFGQLDQYLEPLLDSGYDKLFAAGHLTIYRNVPEVNRLFMSRDCDGESMYRMAFSHLESFAFDEMLWARNIHTLFIEQGASVYEDDLSFNASTKYFELRREYYDPNVRRWIVQNQTPKALWVDASGIHGFYQSSGVSKVQSYIYAHLQGRKMRIPANGSLDSSVQIGPDWFATLEESTGSSGVPSGLHSSFPSYKAMRLALRRIKVSIINTDTDPSNIDPYLPYI
ncbi:DUF6625 family protein [Collinsella sp. LCP19S3_B11]|uniref:DUF6625 family protein n=1 Tax=Collinsella sp. LCP19S3_B11 TaxID=3438754 RepID=UPI003F906D50